MGQAKGRFAVLNQPRVSSHPRAARAAGASATRSFSRRIAALACLAAVAVAIQRYPIVSWPLAVALASYAAVLWRWPVAFLVVLPIVIPAADFGLWTGWMMVEESDLFILVTVAVLSVRRPPEWRDVLPPGFSGAAILLFLIAWTVAAAVGLLSTFGAAPSDNPFLRPDNALRLLKALVDAVVLLPFLRCRQRTHGDAVNWFGCGVAAGSAVVALVVLAERMLFAGVWDFSGLYRVVGPFSSMRLGGGYIGAYVALALPFTLCLTTLRPRWLAALFLVLACLAGGYTLAVTFARTAYAAGVLGMAVAGLAWLWTRHRQQRPSVFAIAPIALMLAGLMAVAALTGMRERFTTIGEDLSTREGNWQAGLAARDGEFVSAIFGMGLGAYPRAMLMRSAVKRPTDIVVRHDPGGPFLSIMFETGLYLGQKISAPNETAHLTMRARAVDRANALGILLCDKVLLYSDNCRGVTTPLPKSDHWQIISAEVSTDGLGRSALLGLLHRPVELSVSGTGGQIDLREIRLTDDAGDTLVTNGDFSRGLDNWVFTDDDHLSWRMKDEYLMLFFETGVFGLVACLGLAGAAIIGALRAVGSHAIGGAAVAGSVAAFLASGLFDNVLEVPRLATLFFLVCFCGLLQWPASPRSAAPAVPLTPRAS